MSDEQDIVRSLRAMSQGWDEWRVQDPKDGSYIMFFSREDGYSVNPENEARDWLAEQKERFPPGPIVNYEIARVHVLTTAEQIMRAAADEIERLRAKQAQIDRLMLEFCPDEMTDKQRAAWEANQVRSAVPERNWALDGGFGGATREQMAAGEHEAAGTNALGRWSPT